MKRLFDIVSSAVALLLLSPLFLIVAVLIKMESRGPVFFGQKRIGRGFLPFTLYTFRTTVDNPSQKGPTAVAGGDIRSTRVGEFLRKTRLVGLPQL
ncbi:MAG: sugar transferase, partial [Thermodesulfobacteriota bacterium]